MEGLMITGGSLCFLGLVFGALTGMILMMLVPAGAGMLVFGAAKLYSCQLRKRAASWRAKYPPYGY